MPEEEEEGRGAAGSEAALRFPGRVLRAETVGNGRAKAPGRRPLSLYPAPPDPGPGRGAEPSGPDSSAAVPSQAPGGLRLARQNGDARRRRERLRLRRRRGSIGAAARGRRACGGVRADRRRPGLTSRSAATRLLSYSGTPATGPGLARRAWSRLASMRQVSLSREGPAGRACRRIRGRRAGPGPGRGAARRLPISRPRSTAGLEGGRARGEGGGGRRRWSPLRRGPGSPPAAAAPALSRGVALQARAGWLGAGGGSRAPGAQPVRRLALPGP